MKESIINRLMSGLVIVKCKRYNVFIRPFSVADKALADVLSQHHYDDLRLDGIPTQEEMIERMMEIGLWSKDKDQQIEELEDTIDNMKVDYFHNFLRDKSREIIRKNIDYKNSELVKLREEKYEFADKTCESLVSQYKLSLLLEKSSYIDNTELLKGKIGIYTLMGEYVKLALSGEEIRSVAKSPEWRTIWLSAKNHASLFANPYSDLTSEQVSFLSWSRFYDNIHESADCPSSDVIEDDIALDGWCIVEQRKRKDEEKKKHAEKMVKGANPNATEILVPVGSQKEIDQVMSLNTGQGKSIVKSVIKEANEKGSVKESQLTHVKNHLHMEANKLQMGKNNG